jgi:hypothetical protein
MPASMVCTIVDAVVALTGTRFSSPTGLWA